MPSRPNELLRLRVARLEREQVAMRAEVESAIAALEQLRGPEPPRRPPLRLAKR